MPGDTIIVPEKLDKFRLTKELKDWSQIFYPVRPRCPRHQRKN
jgi:hypothetical protein